MSRSVVELFREAEDLDDGERATLAGLLLESLEGEPDPDVEAKWSAEIKSRIAEVDSGDVGLIPWEDVKKKLLGGADRGP